MEQKSSLNFVTHQMTFCGENSQFSDKLLTSLPIVFTGPPGGFSRRIRRAEGILSIFCSSQVFNLKPLLVKMMFSSVFIVASAISGALALYSPPRGAITVGKHGKYSNISAAIADNSSDVYFIYAVCSTTFFRASSWI